MYCRLVLVLAAVVTTSSNVPTSCSVTQCHAITLQCWRLALVCRPEKTFGKQRPWLHMVGNSADMSAYASERVIASVPGVGFPARTRS